MQRGRRAGGRAGCWARGDGSTAFRVVQRARSSSGRVCAGRARVGVLGRRLTEEARPRRGQGSIDKGMRAGGQHQRALYPAAGALLSSRGETMGAEKRERATVRAWTERRRRFVARRPAWFKLYAASAGLGWSRLCRTSAKRAGLVCTRRNGRHLPIKPDAPSATTLCCTTVWTVHPT